MAGTLKMNEKGGIIEREEVEAAIAKAVELRSIHAALMQGRNSPAHLHFLSPPPLSQPAPHFSSHDYPVFTPVSLLFHFNLNSFIHFHGSQTLYSFWF